MGLGTMVVYKDLVAQIVSVDSKRPDCHDILVFYPDGCEYIKVFNVDKSELTEFRAKW